MNRTKTFFVGWSDQMPQDQRSRLKKVIIIIFICLPILAFLVVRAQKPFNNFVFEFGNVQELTGIYHAKPVPILELEHRSVPEGISNHALLVGFGKFGAESVISAIEKKSGMMDGRKITILGTLIYGDGKSVVELTKKEESLLMLYDESIPPSTYKDNPIPGEYFGEILDPKCYFGVMKPGEGKIHKSCAIRCISGGIPPVFKANTENGAYVYQILLGPDGEKINKQILDHVGELVRIKGMVSFKNGWEVLNILPGDIQRIKN